MLVARLGPYCSYCERKISAGLEEEHLQPTGLPQYSHLIGTWTNFLLACRNCNATKSKKDVSFLDLIFPDRDNTFAPFTYAPDGKVMPHVGLVPQTRDQANATLSLTGLDKRINNTLDENGKLVALDRVAQRMEAWSVATMSRDDAQGDQDNEPLRRQIARTARESGFFSIWMTVFAGDVDMLNRLINAFEGTRQSGCFDATGDSVTPGPNPDQLPYGSKS